uniref:hypothetical protein n=1 Tax=Orrella sp. TaxID=1921583 RepID=UPI004048A23A
MAFKKRLRIPQSIDHHTDRLAAKCYPDKSSKEAEKLFRLRIKSAIKNGDLQDVLIPDDEVNGWARTIFQNELSGEHLPAVFNASIIEQSQVSDYAIPLPDTQSELNQQYTEAIIKVHRLTQEVLHLKEENAALRNKKSAAGKRPKKRR